MYKFGKNIEAGDMALFYGEYVEGGIALDAWDEEGPFSDVSICVPGVPLKENEIILNHDILWDNEFVNAFSEYICTGEKRPVRYGPFGVESAIVTLKLEWRDLCIAM